MMHGRALSLLFSKLRSNQTPNLRYLAYACGTKKTALKGKISALGEDQKRRYCSGMAHDRATCTFCKIVDTSGEVENGILYQDEEVVVINDIRPATAHHFLVLPRQHLANARDLGPRHARIIQHMVETGRNVMEEKADLSPEKCLLGFHWPPFTSISHLHLHVIAPRTEMSFFGRLIFRENSYWFVSPETVLERLNKNVQQTQ